MLNKNKLTRFFTIAFALPVMILAIFLNSSNASNKDATRFVTDITTEVMNVVKSTSLNNSQKEADLAKLFQKYVDVQWVGKFSLGKNWRIMSEAQHKEFSDVFSTYLTNTYVHNFKNYTSKDVKILNVAETAENEYLVQTKIINKENNTNIKVNFRLFQKGTNSKDFVVFDIVVEGVSMISTQRSEFSSTINQSGVEALINLLKAKKDKKTPSSK